ncbi:MAG: hypothetical protein ABSF52_17915, partial [Syntrophobacteraceae bacterium]
IDVDMAGISSVLFDWSQTTRSLPCPFLVFNYPGTRLPEDPKKVCGVWQGVSGFSEMRVAMTLEWRQLSTLTKIFYIGGLISFLGLAIMILTGMTSIGDVIAWKFKLCPWCM